MFNWRITAAVATAVMVASVGAITLMGRAQAGGSQPQANSTAPVQIQDRAKPLPGELVNNDPIPEWVPPKKHGRFEGYCENGKPVITKAPEDTTEIKPFCAGTILGTELTYKQTESTVDPLNPANWPARPPDFALGAHIRLNGSMLVDPRREKDVFPYVTSVGRTLVPARWIVEAVGGKIFWKPDEQRVRYVWKDREIIMWVGKTDAEVNGKSVTLDQAPLMVAGRTMVPARFVAESLGGTVTWDDFNMVVHMQIDGAACPLSYCFDRRSETK